ncbi:DesA family fatty acid desaturase [Paraburkholderia phenazinium]|uniref:Stearoyl-CoA desaturase (Delta-9 desaturase) n=1 Tax=Paraburkholderia phenazinium TaxID=60549 RepID=A0A1G7SDB5_9BURK|nr:fatty acid desaturase [Paraburkholderia phenazinium]SDG20961.1 stearoyl-CoA desaturase (delta-9 desaturase) [Paraburkholderia phenazinium]
MFRTSLDFFSNGLLGLSWWQIVLTTLLLTHVTIISVTVYLHRCQAHRALELHPVVSHGFRFWLWLTTGMVTGHWAAVHRKHHAKCETAEDPHSPQAYGIWKVLLCGAELYGAETRNEETLRKFAYGTPNDWIERNLYARYPNLGVSLLMVLDVALFGILGVSVWAVQMIWIPFWAGGVVNGVGHFRGYRNFDTADASTNVIPFGILIGGEELHNNHHAYAASARLSNKWYELDIGWMYISILSALGLAKVRKVAPRPHLVKGKTVLDDATLQAVLRNRYEVMASYTKVAERVSRQEQGDQRLHIYVELREELVAMWERSNVSREQLLLQLQDWCRRAELSGIDAIEEFSLRLRQYA